MEQTQCFNHVSAVFIFQSVKGHDISLCQQKLHIPIFWQPRSGRRLSVPVLGTCSCQSESALGCHDIRTCMLVPCGVRMYMVLAVVACMSAVATPGWILPVRQSISRESPPVFVVPKSFFMVPKSQLSTLVYRTLVYLVYRTYIVIL